MVVMVAATPIMGVDEELEACEASPGPGRSSISPHGPKAKEETIEGEGRKRSWRDIFWKSQKAPWQWDMFLTIGYLQHCVPLNEIGNAWYLLASGAHVCNFVKASIRQCLAWMIELNHPTSFDTLSSEL